MHTKGEWKVVDKRTLQGSFMIMPSGSGGAIARVYFEANANLIASAPRMYEALERVLYSPLSEATREIVEKALVKAGGR